MEEIGEELEEQFKPITTLEIKSTKMIKRNQTLQIAIPQVIDRS